MLCTKTCIFLRPSSRKALGAHCRTTQRTLVPRGSEDAVQGSGCIEPSVSAGRSSIAWGEQRHPSARPSRTAHRASENPEHAFPAWTGVPQTRPCLVQPVCRLCCARRGREPGKTEEELTAAFADSQRLWVVFDERLCPFPGRARLPPQPLRTVIQGVLFLYCQCLVNAGGRFMAEHFLPQTLN